MSDRPPTDTPVPASEPAASTPPSPETAAPVTIPAALLAQLLAGPVPLPYGTAPPGTPLALPGGMPVLLGQQAQISTQIWQGQFPSPASVEHYENVLPGSFDRIIKMAEIARGPNRRGQASARIYQKRYEAWTLVRLCFDVFGNRCSCRVCCFGPAVGCRCIGECACNGCRQVAYR
jgi:hypothetical protein